jgi:hypothetical protein
MIAWVGVGIVKGTRGVRVDNFSQYVLHNFEYLDIEVGQSMA